MWCLTIERRAYHILVEVGALNADGVELETAPALQSIQPFILTAVMLPQLHCLCSRVTSRHDRTGIKDKQPG